MRKIANFRVSSPILNNEISRFIARGINADSHNNPHVLRMSTPKVVTITIPYGSKYINKCIYFHLILTRYSIFFSQSFYLLFPFCSVRVIFRFIVPDCFVLLQTLGEPTLIKIGRHFVEIELCCCSSRKHEICVVNGCALIIPLPTADSRHPPIVFNKWADNT